MKDIILFGNCLETLDSFPNNTARCCITSPPYFGLRDYGHEDQIGNEQTPSEYITNLVNVFRKVRRVLTDDGILWVNIGDSYAGAGYSNHKNTGGAQRSDGGKQRHLIGTGCKNKDLIGIPWMLAFALREDGWYLRQDIIWHKPNPMPESVKDRCTKSHEYLFLLSKSEKYYFNSEAIREPCVGSSQQRSRRSVWTVPIKPYKGAHFATFPQKLIEPCVLAGSERGDIILDPFMGSGTTAEVAIIHNRHYIGCELNDGYKPLQDQRIMYARQKE